MGQRGFREFREPVEGGQSVWPTVFNANTGYGRGDVYDNFIKISQDPIDIGFSKPDVVQESWLAA